MNQNQSLFPYTSQQLLSLADNEHFARSSRGIALPYRWQSLAQSEAAFWGEYPQKDKELIRTQVSLIDMHMQCSCASKTFPCHHALALVLIFQENPQAFTAGLPAVWVQQAKNNKPKRQQTKEKPSLDLWQKQGLEMLEKWIFDLVYLGLEQARGYPYTFWHEMANRLVDARLGILADDLRTWGQGISQDAWSQELLAKMGKVQILLEAFKRFNSLPVAIQADLLQALGIKPALASEVCQDRWLVIGRGNTQTSSRKLERIWLKSLSTGQIALIENILIKPDMTETRLLTGLCLNASLHFYEASVPLQAELVEIHQVMNQTVALQGELSINQALKRLSAAKAANPWLSVFPMHLSSISIENSETDWVLIDQEGYQVILPKRSVGRWQMQAQAFEQGLSVFGEYRNKQFIPLSMETRHGWLDLKNMRGGN